MLLCTLFQSKNFFICRFEDGKCEAFSILCKIFSCKQRVSFNSLYIEEFYYALERVFLEERPSYFISVLMNSNDLFTSGLVGVWMLIPGFSNALHNLIFKLPRQLTRVLNFLNL